VADENYWRTLFDLMDRYDFTLFADECYADIYLDKQPLGAMTARYSQSGGLVQLLSFHSLSKRSALPGLRSGMVAGDPALLTRFRAFRNYAGPQVAMPIMAASAEAWRDEAHVAANRAAYQKKMAAAKDILGDRMTVPDGGFFLWLDVGNGEEAARTLWREDGIRVLPGAYMGRPENPADPESNPGFRYVRVALVSDLVTIEAALVRMADRLSGTA
jgi:aspartate/methionine/tyrosine aminotransferase